MHIENEKRFSSKEEEEEEVILSECMDFFDGRNFVAMRFYLLSHQMCMCSHLSVSTLWMGMHKDT